MRSAGWQRSCRASFILTDDGASSIQQQATRWVARRAASPSSRLLPQQPGGGSAELDMATQIFT